MNADACSIGWSNIMGWKIIDPRSRNKEKENATSRGEPWVNITDIHVNEENRIVAVIDYNKHFVDYIRKKSGHHDKNDDAIVQDWFRGYWERRRMDFLNNGDF